MLALVDVRVVEMVALAVLLTQSSEIQVSLFLVILLILVSNSKVFFLVSILILGWSFFEDVFAFLNLSRLSCIDRSLFRLVISVRVPVWLASRIITIG